jgi:hypothetical protein
VLPPKAYACSKRGGGVQHGEWSERTRQLRSEGYYIGNIMASLDTQSIIEAPGHSELRIPVQICHRFHSKPATDSI